MLSYYPSPALRHPDAHQSFRKPQSSPLQASNPLCIYNCIIGNKVSACSVIFLKTFSTNHTQSQWVTWGKLSFVCFWSIKINVQNLFSRVMSRQKELLFLRVAFRCFTALQKCCTDRWMTHSLHSCSEKGFPQCILVLTRVSEMTGLCMQGRWLGCLQFLMSFDVGLVQSERSFYFCWFYNPMIISLLKCLFEVLDSSPFSDVMKWVEVHVGNTL